jgi:hypothetical protein
MAREVDFAVPLASYALLPLLDQCLFPQFPYLSFVTHRQAGFVLRRNPAVESLKR